MAIVELRQFGSECDFEFHGSVTDSWSGGKRLLFLFGENHKDREMIRLNLLNACRLCNLGVLRCVGVEEPTEDLLRWGQTGIEEKSRILFKENQDDGGVI